MSNNDIIVPDLPESVADAVVLSWHKQPGDLFKCNDVLVEIETDKVILEVPATVDGILVSILKDNGSLVTSKEVLGHFKLNEQSSSSPHHSDPGDKLKLSRLNSYHLSPPDSTPTQDESPTVRRLVAEHNNLQNNNSSRIKGSGVGGRLTRIDIKNYLEHQNHNNERSNMILRSEQKTDKRVPMSRLRKRIAERLLETKNNTAMLTTFNEVNMKKIIDLRSKYGEKFQKIHGIRLGFMSFYVKAVIAALKKFPELNAYIDGDEVVYHDYFDISIAISTPRGLVTPVLHNVDLMSIADIEKKIKVLAVKGKEGKLTVDEITGGNFTITNGGIFGSLISTPIINPPQIGILGMHAVKDRPMAVNGNIIILPMMYLALSYDHRLIDGREAVSSLVTIKEIIEDPNRLILEV
ncbi:MAG: dihydrolipoyllysine-residue succinyltransferase [Candidatus Dasytiphilus stammeri]